MPSSTSSGRRVDRRRYLAVYRTLRILEAWLPNACSAYLPQPVQEAIVHAYIETIPYSQTSETTADGSAAPLPDTLVAAALAAIEKGLAESNYQFREGDNNRVTDSFLRYAQQYSQQLQDFDDSASSLSANTASGTASAPASDDGGEEPQPQRVQEVQFPAANTDEEDDEQERRVVMVSAVQSLESELIATGRFTLRERAHVIEVFINLVNGCRQPDPSAKVAYAFDRLRRADPAAVLYGESSPATCAVLRQTLAGPQFFTIEQAHALERRRARRVRARARQREERARQLQQQQQQQQQQGQGEQRARQNQRQHPAVHAAQVPWRPTAFMAANVREQAQGTRPAQRLATRRGDGSEQGQYQKNSQHGKVKQPQRSPAVSASSRSSGSQHSSSQGRLRMRKQIILTKDWDTRTVAEGVACVICQDGSDSTSKMRSLNCNHQFHIDCVKSWWREKPICPLCRK